MACFSIIDRGIRKIAVVAALETRLWEMQVIIVYKLVKLMTKMDQIDRLIDITRASGYQSLPLQIYIIAYTFLN